MTVEKFDRLAQQLSEVEVESFEMLKSIITLVFDKALSEPNFGEVWQTTGGLCCVCVIRVMGCGG